MDHSSGKPLTVHLAGNLMTFRARGSETGGQLSIVEALTAPGEGAPPHRQTDGESFLVLEGEYEFMLDGAARRCGPGDFVHAAAGQVHAFRNTGDAPARMLILNTPAGPHEAFIIAAGDEVPAGTRDFPGFGPAEIDRLVAAAHANAMEVLPPA